ncbi:MAG: hypothetical protein QXU18_02445 [Thermoplasmatales archaeon]
MKKVVFVVSTYPEFRDKLNEVLLSLYPNDGWDVVVVTNCGFQAKDERILVLERKFQYWNEAFYWFYNNYDYDFITPLDDDDSFGPNKLRRLDELSGRYDYIHNYARYTNESYRYNAISNNSSCIAFNPRLIDINLFKETRSLNDFFLYLNFVGSDRKINLPEYLTNISFRKFTDYLEFKAYLEKRYLLRYEDLLKVRHDFKLKPEQLKVVNREICKYVFMLQKYNRRDIIGSIFSGDRYVLNTMINRKKGLDYFIREEYLKRYGARQ